MVVVQNHNCLLF